MNEQQREVQQQFLHNEQEALDALKKNYQDALDEINDRIALLLGRADADMQHVIYQVEYQKALKEQVNAILERMNANNFTTLSDYLTQSYEDGFIGTLYDLQSQGIPLIFPIDQRQVVEAIQHETQLSEGLYTRLGKDTNLLKRQISQEISRGISNGEMVGKIGNNISQYAGISKNNAMRIARTESHRIQIKSTQDAQWKAKEKGADVVKQWDSTLDGKTRDTHRELDGQIRELEDDFEIGGMKASAPGMFGIPSEDINCRCALLQRARWALGNDYTKWSEDAPVLISDDGTTQFVNVKAKDYNDFKNKYKKITSEGAKNTNSYDSLLQEHERIQKEKASIDAELKNSKNDLTFGRYQEQELEKYKDVSSFTSEEISGLRKKASKLDEINKEIEEVSDKYYNRPDRKTQRELYNAWREQREELSSRLDKLMIKQSDAYNAQRIVDNYDKYLKKLDEIKENGVLTKKELTEKIDSLLAKSKKYDAQLSDLIKKLESDPDYYDKVFKSDVRKSLEASKVEYRKVKSLEKELSIDEIVSRLGGGDKTEGSCASLGLAYIGNRNGLDVLDFRDGKSRETFSRTSNLREIANLKGVTSSVETGYNNITNSKKLLKTLEEGKEYYFVTGQHAAMVRKNQEGVLEYLELQSASSVYTNGWHSFDTYGSIDSTLSKRFGAKKSRTSYGHKFEQTSFIIDADSLKDNVEFKKLLGYINTSSNKQVKGVGGNVK